jgi:type II secretory pathway pseudopilin PulG
MRISNRVAFSLRSMAPGQSITEVIIAMFIFSVGILGVTHMQVSSMRGNSRAIKLTNAIQLASKQMEEIMIMVYDDPRLSDDDNDGAPGLNDDSTADEVHPGNPIKAGDTAEQYNIYWNVAVDWPLPNAKTIRVIVQWNEGGLDRSSSFDYIKSKGT